MNTDNLSVLKWIRRAQMDASAASTLVETRFRPPIEVVCYLCQQAAEKILKAYTIAKTGSRIKTHELDDILNECAQYSADFNNLRNSCSKVAAYLAIGRYPSLIEPTEYNMKEALAHTSQILVFTISKLKELGYE
jgi:HEPN domain-containing protein